MPEPKNGESKQPEQIAIPSEYASRARSRPRKAPVERWEAEDKERIRKGLSKALPETALSETALDKLASTKPVWTVKPDEPAPASSHEFVERMMSEEGLAAVREAVIRRVIPFGKIVGAWLGPAPPEPVVSSPKGALQKRERDRIISPIDKLKKALAPLAEHEDYPLTDKEGRLLCPVLKTKDGLKALPIPITKSPSLLHRDWIVPVLDALRSSVQNLPVRRAERPSTFVPFEKHAARQLAAIDGRRRGVTCQSPRTTATGSLGNCAASSSGSGSAGRSPARPSPTL